MRKRIGIFGVTEEVLRLLHLLDANPEVQVLRFWDEDRSAALERANRVGPEVAAQIAPLFSEDVEEFGGRGDLDAVIDTSGEARFAHLFPRAVDRGMQIVSPLTARLLWGYGIASQDRKAELLQALGEVVESVDLAIDSDELFLRMLDIAVGVTGADGGSLMLLDARSQELVIRVAIGVEPELWPKIRVSLGEGIAGRVAADARPLRLRGKADAQAFHLVHERLDVESALCVPLVHGGKVLGVLNLHHGTRADAFSEQDLAFMEQIAHLDSQIISRAQEHEALRNQAARYQAVRDVQGLLASPDPLLDRLQSLCRFVAEHVGDGIVTVYLYDAEDKELRMAATSLEGGGFGGEYRVTAGQGVDGRVAETGQSIFLREENGAVAYVSLPLHAGDRLVGVLSIQSGDSPPRGRASEEILLEMAAALAEGIAHADREARMAARATRASAINESGIRMISANDVGEVARIATSSAAMILEAEHAVLRLQDEQTRRYVIRSYFGPADGRQQEKLFRLDKEASVDTLKRRTGQLVRDLQADPALGALAEDFRSLMAAPLKRDGRVIGTLLVYDKIAPDHFYADHFNDDDFHSFTRFVSYVERAVANSLFQAQARQHRNFDEETGLPNASYISKRIHEEIARSQGREGALALTVCRIENLQEILLAASPAHAQRVILQSADALRAHLRDFDVLARTDDGEFTVLMPDPGPAPGERVFELARSVADAIAKDEVLNAPQRIALAFGYAVHPGDGPERESLLERARTPRIRMV